MLRVVALIAAASAWPKSCNRPGELKHNEACAREIGAQRVTCAASGPHEHNNGIAIVFRGEPFRGLTYAVQGIPKQVHACTRHAIAIQRAIGRAQVARLIAPLEKEFAVDVYLAATANPSCKAVQHLPQLYGRRRVVNFTTAAWVRQNDAAAAGMQAVAASGRRYRSILMFLFSVERDCGPRLRREMVLDAVDATFSTHRWRFDVVPIMPIHPPVRGVPFSNYVAMSANRALIYSGDWAWSVPGEFQDCAVDIFSRGCWSKPCGMIGGCCRINLVSNFPGEVVNVGYASPTNMRDTKTYNVYRDDYTPHGHAICASLQRLGGPPCPTRAEGVRIACERIREAFLLAGHRPASQLPPNSKKRCVPMTGKQQCERVPGGCAAAAH